MYCCHGIGELENEAFQHQSRKRNPLVRRGQKVTRGSAPGRAEVHWVEGRKESFQSGKSQECGQGEEARAIREKVFA